MTIGDASILIGIVFLILTNMIRILNDKASAAVSQKLLNQIVLTQKLQGADIVSAQEDPSVLKRRVDQHDDEFKAIRKDFREIGGQT